MMSLFRENRPSGAQGYVQDSWLRWVWASPWICVVLSRSELAGVMMEQTAAYVLGSGGLLCPPWGSYL